MKAKKAISYLMEVVVLLVAVRWLYLLQKFLLDDWGIGYAGRLAIAYCVPFLFGAVLRINPFLMRCKEKKTV